MDSSQTALPQSISSKFKRKSFIRASVIENDHEDDRKIVDQNPVNAAQDIIIDINHDLDGAEIQEWINGVIGLPQYYKNFVKAGYVSLAQITQIRFQSELRDIGILNYAHCDRIWQVIIFVNELNESIQIFSVSLYVDEYDDKV